MAVFSVLNGIGFDSNNDAIGDGVQFGFIFSTIAASGVIGLPIITPTFGSILFNDVGNLTLTGSGMSYIPPVTVTGTVTDLSYIQQFIPVFPITGFSIPLATIATTLLGGGGEPAVLATIFSGNDTIGGSNMSDVLLGFDGTDTLRGGGGDILAIYLDRDHCGGAGQSPP